VGASPRKILRQLQKVQNNGRFGEPRSDVFMVRSPNRPSGGLAVIAILAGFENLSASPVAQRGSKPFAGDARSPTPPADRQA